MKDIKKIILDTIQYTMSKFFYYDRKEDEDLTVTELAEAVKDGHITKEEIKEKFCEIIDTNIP